MSVLSNSIKSSQSPETLNAKSTFFCCCQRESEEYAVEIEKTITIEDDPEMSKSLLIEEPSEDPNPEEEKEVEITPEVVIETVEPEILNEEMNTETKSVLIVGEKINNKTKTAEVQLKIGIYCDKSSLTMTIIDALDLIRSSVAPNTAEKTNPVVSYSIHILVLPLRKLRFKTTLRKGPDAYFNEVIKVPKVNPENVKSWTLRLRLYGTMRNSSQEVIGEGFLFLDSLDLSKRTQCKVALMSFDPNVPENAVDCLMSSNQCNYDEMVSLEQKIRSSGDQKDSELLIGLSYNFTIGRFSMEVVRGFNFPKLKGSKEPDTFIKVVVTSKKDEELLNLKTLVKKGTWAPVFEETFIFKVPYKLLEDITLTVSGSHKTQETFGFFKIGNSNSSENETSHWQELINSSCGQQLLRWHKFQSMENT